MQSHNDRCTESLGFVAEISLMRSVFSVLIFGTCLIATTEAMSASATQGDASTTVAREAFNQGLRHFNSGDFDAAITDFETALQTKYHPTVLFNLALAYAAAGLPIKAVATMQRYLAEVGTTLPAARLGVANAFIQTQSKLLGAIDVRNTEPGIAISLDGVEVGTTPLARISVVRGTHALVASRAGFTQEIVRVQVQANQTSEVHLRLIASPTSEFPKNDRTPARLPVGVSTSAAPTHVATSPPPMEPRAHTLERIGIASIGAAVAGIGLGTYFALCTRASWADREQHCSSGVCDDRAVEAWHDAKRSAFAADLSFASALIAGGVGVYLVVVGHRDGGVHVPSGGVGLGGQPGTLQVRWIGTL